MLGWGRKSEGATFHIKVCAACFLAITLIGGALFSTFADISDKHRTFDLEKTIDTGHGRGYTPHAPIRIDSDLGFTNASGVTHGLGTQGDPYLFEDWEIDGTGYGYAFYAGNTTAYFVVKGCHLHHA